jgi:lipoate synthase
MSQYGLYCYNNCQVWHGSIVRLSMDYIVIIAVARPDSYDNNIIHTETYNTPVSDLTAMITIESILRHTILQCQT